MIRCDSCDREPATVVARIDVVDPTDGLSGERAQWLGGRVPGAHASREGKNDVRSVIATADADTAASATRTSGGVITGP